MSLPLLAFINGRNDVFLGILAAVLIAFSLVAALVMPRRFPNFPGRHLRLFGLASAALVAGMITAVAVLGESHHFPSAQAATGQGQGGQTTSTPSSTTAQATTNEATTGAATTAGGTSTASGDAAAGKAVFTSAGCAACHTFTAAGASGTVGPDLDKALAGKSADFVHQSIVDPNAVITPGFPPNVMPQDFGQKLSAKQLADLVAFLLANRSG